MFLVVVRFGRFYELKLHRNLFVRSIRVCVPDVSFICGIFYVIADCLEHTTRRGHKTAIKYLYKK